MALEELASDSLSDFVLDSLAPESEMELVPDSFEPESEMELVPDSLLPESQPSLCVRCGTTHGDNDVEGYRLARREASRCDRCRLVHRDYDLVARIMDDLDKFDCVTYIPDLEKLEMDGDTILGPEHILKKLDEQRKMKQDAKKNHLMQKD